MRVAIYLRVSTVDQATKGNTNRDGFSIPAQREACKQKAKSLGATVIKEYTDRGESARSAARPALQQLLSDLCEKKHFNYVVVHKIDRLARNLHDDVMIGLAIKKGGAQLVSVTENIDETPSGRLLHGIMAAMAEFYSRNLAMEALKGSTEKAKQGGTPYMAPIGYLNIRETISRREIRTVTPDPERASLIRWGLERYSTGGYSELSLQAGLASRGLRSRLRTNSASEPISLSGLDRMLSNRYYIGFVNYRGVEYKGKHQPLITPAVFAAIQAVKASHYPCRNKHRKHSHHLSRLLVCGLCHRHLCFTVAKGRYDYFFCINKQANGCPQPYIPARLVEEALIKTIQKLALTLADRQQLTKRINEELDGEQRLAENDIRHQTQRLNRLQVEQENVLRTYHDKLINPDLLKSEQKRIVKGIEQARAVIQEAEERRLIITNRRDRALEISQSLDIQKVYLNANPVLRRLLCRALFADVIINDHIIDNKRGVGVWREHTLSIVKVNWHNPIDAHHLSEAIMSLSIEKELGT